MYVMPPFSGLLTMLLGDGTILQFFHRRFHLFKRYLYYRKKKEVNSVNTQELYLIVNTRTR